MKKFLFTLLMALPLSLTVLAADEVTVSVSTPGTLGEQILTKTENLSDVVTLHVGGTINADDATLIRESLTHLRNLDMTNLQLTELPKDFMYNRDTLRTVVFPKVLKTIGERAFYDCDNLESYQMSEGVEAINDYAFYDCQQLNVSKAANTVRTIGEYAFAYCKSIPRWEMPNNLTTLGRSAFYHCENMQQLTLPSTLKVIPNDAFQYVYSLEALTIPEGVEEIGRTAFYQAFWRNESQSAAKQIHLTMPSTLKKIGSEAFAYNYNIVSLVLNEGLETLESECFANTRITEVTVPSTVSYARSPFYQCNTLAKVTCLPIVPPANYDRNFINGTSKNTLANTKLVVPAVSMNEYKLTEGYNRYTSYEATTQSLPTAITIGRDFHLTTVSGLPKMDITMVRDLNNGYSAYSGMGTLTVDGTETLSAGQLSLLYDKYNEKYYKWNNYSSTSDPYGTKAGKSDDYAKSATTLVVNAPMRADAISTAIRFNYDEWHFITLPYNVRVGDIIGLPLDEYGRRVQEGTEVTDYFVIFEYDGNARASMRSGETWKRLTDSDVMQAGKGYILQGWSRHTIPHHYSDGSDYSSDTQPWLSFPALDDASKNKIFLNTDATIAVTPHASELAHNANWNLVGNPYPCYVNGTALGFDGIVTIWNNYREQYEALSMTDDAYVFSPYEAFFVQTAVGQTGIAMSKDGRQISRKIPEVLGARADMAQNSDRKVINITLNPQPSTLNSTGDRTRVVINPAARQDYEIGRDASKMESLSEQTASLYTLQNGVQMAINERPLGEGLVNLGMKVAEVGTYTIALSSEPGISVELIDQQENTVTALNGTSYTFQAKGGQTNSRFVLRIGGTTTGVAEIENGGLKMNDAASYNLNGQRINDSHKGIVVKNGKKFIVK